MFVCLPVGLGGIVLIRAANGFLHPLGVDSPEFERVVHPTGHYLFTQEIKILGRDEKTEKHSDPAIEFVSLRGPDLTTLTALRTSSR